MPVIRIGNFKIPGGYVARHGREECARQWRSDVRLALWRAIQAINVPGIEDRDSITFVFDTEWEPSGGEEATDPKTAYVFLEGFEDRDDRPLEMRQAMARAIGQALVDKLEVRWNVEVMPRGYNSEREGATLVGPPADPPGTGYLPRRRYKFLVLVFQNGKLDEEVETPVYEFESEEALAAGLVAFAAQNSRVATDSRVMDLWSGKLTIFPPSVRRGLGPDTTLVIKDVIRVKD